MVISMEDLSLETSVPRHADFINKLRSLMVIDWSIPHSEVIYKTLLCF